MYYYPKDIYEKEYSDISKVWEYLKKEKTIDDDVELIFGHMKNYYNAAHKKISFAPDEVAEYYPNKKNAYILTLLHEVGHYIEHTTNEDRFYREFAELKRLMTIYAYMYDDMKTIQKLYEQLPSEKIANDYADLILEEIEPILETILK